MTGTASFQEKKVLVGSILAKFRDQNGVSQSDVARSTQYSRSSIAHIESGKQFPRERAFWEAADEAVKANGALLNQFDTVSEEVAQAEREEKQRKSSEYLARLTRATSGALNMPIADLEPIDSDFLEKMHRDIRTFIELDQRYGGTAASPLIVQAYRQIRHRIERSEIRDGLWSDVYSALAELAEVAGWSLYDSDDDESTAAVNNEALSWARMAGDKSMETFIWQNKAMHAESIGIPRQSIDFAKGILDNDRLSPRVEGLFRLRLARSYGKLRGESDAKRELSRARNLIQDGFRDDDPPWSWWVNDAQLFWFEGAIRLDLGESRDAVEFLEQSASAIPEPRMHFIYRAWALYAHCVNQSWRNVDASLIDLMGDAGVYRSRRANNRITRALALIDSAHAPSAVREHAEQLRSVLKRAEETSPFVR